jgi:hypothetical protein
MRIFLILFLLQFSLYANKITPNEVYSQVKKIENEIHFLLKLNGIKHNHKSSMKDIYISTNLKPRNVWYKTYEIMVKINILRIAYKLPVVEPVNLAPVLNLNPDLVYEQTQRILTEIYIFKLRMGIKTKIIKTKRYINKTPQDVFNLLSVISKSLDKLNNATFTPSYAFGENIRVNNDLSTILHHLNIKDNTIPSVKNDNATPSDTFTIAMQTLHKIAQIQKDVGIQSVDFSAFRKDNPSPGDVFTMAEMIIAELQTIKAFIGLNTYITPAATQYKDKTPAEVEQLMHWNLRKLNLITTLATGGGINR